jgi:CheY-like chemotaxis protein
MSSASRIILVVEDADLCATTLEIALHALPDLVIKSTPTAEEALKVLLREKVSALITDLHLPRMDGFELIARVRSEPRHSRLPILVISGDSDFKTPERAIRLGANAFFAKPYSPAAVRLKLEQLMNAT